MSSLACFVFLGDFFFKFQLWVVFFCCGVSVFAYSDDSRLYSRRCNVYFSEASHDWKFLRIRSHLLLMNTDWEISAIASRWFPIWFGLCLLCIDSMSAPGQKGIEKECVHRKSVRVTSSVAAADFPCSVAPRLERFFRYSQVQWPSLLARQPTV